MHWCLAILIGIFLVSSTFSTTQHRNRRHRVNKRMGVAVGYTEKLNFSITEPRYIKTLSLSPLIFEIRDFLTADECQYLIALAKRQGLKDSPTHPQPENFHTSRSVFLQWDLNNDTYIDVSEFTYIKGKGDIFVTKSDILEMMRDLKIDNNGDNRMDYTEFVSVTGNRIKEYFSYLYRMKPRTRSRFSMQAWVWHRRATGFDFDNFHQKISQATHLPMDLIEKSEPIQVVRYQRGGHYHCHHDSDEVDSSVPCCTYTQRFPCRQCRLLTLMFYLNNVTEGGETAFPLADNETFSMSAWENEAPEKCNLATYCHRSNLLLRPQQGTCVLWYNHKLDEGTGLMGNLDFMSYHGGCDVLGEEQKWIANSWINVNGDRGWLDTLLPGMEIKGEL